MRIPEDMPQSILETPGPVTKNGKIPLRITATPAQAAPPPPSYQHHPLTASAPARQKFPRDAQPASPPAEPAEAGSEVAETHSTSKTVVHVQSSDDIALILLFMASRENDVWAAAAAVDIPLALPNIPLRPHIARIEDVTVEVAEHDVRGEEFREWEDHGGW